MLSKLFFIIILTGTLSKANPGVLEKVAERRVQNEWGLTEITQDTLIAVEDCNLLGYEAIVKVDGKEHKSQIVDCEASHHNHMKERGLVADINNPDLVHKEAEVIIKIPYVVKGNY